MEETQNPEESQTNPEVSESEQSERPSDQEVKERQEAELAEERAEHLRRTEGTSVPDTNPPAEEEPSDEGLPEEDAAS